MKPWHIRINRYGRAFVPAPGPALAIVLWLRGWRPFESLCVSRGRWWSIPSHNTRRDYPECHAIWWDGNPRPRISPGAKK